MRALLVLGLALALAPATVRAQDDAGVPPPRPDAGTPSLAPADVVASEADSLGPRDATADAVEAAEGWLVDGQRRDAVRHGIVSGYYAEMGRTMRSGFHPDLVQIEAERRQGMSVPELVLDELGRYGPPEAPRGPAAVYTPEVAAPHPEDPAEVAAMQYFETQSLLNAHTRWSRVEVHVIQDRAGHVLSATVTHGSDSRSLDRAAIEAITSAALAQPPPASVLGERQTIDSDWSFWAGEVVPYVGQLGCMEGPDGQGMQCTALGRPLLRTRVVLLDVHDAEHERHEPTPPATPPAPSATPRRDRAPSATRRSPSHDLGDPRPETPPDPSAPVRDVSPDLPTHALAPP